MSENSRGADAIHVDEIVGSSSSPLLSLTSTMIQAFSPSPPFSPPTAFPSKVVATYSINPILQTVIIPGFPPMFKTITGSNQVLHRHRDSGSTLDVHRQVSPLSPLDPVCVAIQRTDTTLISDIQFISDRRIWRKLFEWIRDCDIQSKPPVLTINQRSRRPIEEFRSDIFVVTTKSNHRLLLFERVTSASTFSSNPNFGKAVEDILTEGNTAEEAGGYRVICQVEFDDNLKGLIRAETDGVILKRIGDIPSQEDTDDSVLAALSNLSLDSSNTLSFAVRTGGVPLRKIESIIEIKSQDNKFYGSEWSDACDVFSIEMCKRQDTLLQMILGGNDYLAIGRYRNEGPKGKYVGTTLFTKEKLIDSLGVNGRNKWIQYSHQLKMVMKTLIDEVNKTENLSFQTFSLVLHCDNDAFVLKLYPHSPPPSSLVATSSTDESQVDDRSGITHSILPIRGNSSQSNENTTSLPISTPIPSSTSSAVSEPIREWIASLP